MVDKADLYPWVALKQAPGIGNRIFTRLIRNFGDPAHAIRAPRGRLLLVEGISEKLADIVLACRVTDRVRKEVALLEEKGFRLITQNHPEYPPLLLEIHDPPPYLYANGQSIDPLPAVAVVGSRNPTRYGITMAQRLSADLAAIGFVIVSGMARGIDTAAHQGALSAGGKTIAVLGSGLSVIYPPENRKLYSDIARSGTIVSELPISEPPNSFNFPARNRIISGMTLGTIVVEAAQKSGSLITAKLAADQGREVFAVPGNINSCKSTGAHNLLKHGAKLVEKVDDILEELTHMIHPEPTVRESSLTGSGNRPSRTDLTSDESDVYYSLDPYPVHIDELSRRLSKDTASLSAVLLKLELKGIICQMPGKYFCISGE